MVSASHNLMQMDWLPLRKWKFEILYYIAFRDIHRFSELRRHIGEITESSLTKQLRELDANGFISRYDFKEVPPHVKCPSPI